jgi:hypothetical protein
MRFVRETCPDMEPYTPPHIIRNIIISHNPSFFFLTYSVLNRLGLEHLRARVAKKSMAGVVVPWFNTEIQT